MGSVRQDKFKIGDKVTWVDDHYATLTDGREELGDGPFNVIRICDVPLTRWPSTDDQQQTNWQSMGHTQHVTIDADNEKYSGAYFKKIDEPCFAISDDIELHEKMLAGTPPHEEKE